MRALIVIALAALAAVCYGQEFDGSIAAIVRRQDK